MALWGPQADICSCLFSTWTCEAPGWELLPNFCQKRKLERLGRGHCTAPALVMSKASNSKHLDSTKGRLSPGYLSAEAEGTLLIPTMCSMRGWSPMHTGRLVAEAHTGQQSP